ncbi:response regulator transcription factor [Methylocystis parvus]|uniref:Response regulator transcription factor n=1 Tax=Methylocystis parvus TaxID=134 RepID=A0A6B8M1H0_9HYPH|nr:response regulator transcription factor [Methylocystis parvus]QGM96711.1 response regulator transcription factor [Methylocystis parvus]WBJ99423.1 response regulator transcription factor [Methylocystis parvus OBBP]
MRILIVDDHPMVIAGCRGMLAGEADMEALEAQDAERAFDVFAREAPDIVVLDVNLPDMSGYDLLRRMLKRRPKARILVYTMNADPVHASRAIELGALGYMSKNEDPALFVKAVRLVGGGQRYVSDDMAHKLAFFNQKKQTNPFLDLTPREKETLRLLADGKGMAEIAHDMGICYKSVANSCALLNRKLGARSRVDLVRIAVEAKAAKHIL